MELKSNKNRYGYLNNLGTKQRGLAFIDAYFKTRDCMTYIKAFSKGSQEIDVNVHSPRKRILGSRNTAPS